MTDRRNPKNFNDSGLVGRGKRGVIVILVVVLVLVLSLAIGVIEDLLCNICRCPRHIGGQAVVARWSRRGPGFGRDVRRGWIGGYWPW